MPKSFGVELPCQLKGTTSMPGMLLDSVTDIQIYSDSHTVKCLYTTIAIHSLTGKGISPKQL
jgi:hypothetical protein